MKVRTETNIIVMSRLRLLYETISDIAAEFSNSSELTESLKKGVYESELIESVNFKILNPNGELVAEFVLKIDWQKHQINCLNSNGNKFQIDTQKSVAEQVLSISEIISSFIYDIRSDPVGYKITYNYTYTAEASQTQTRLEETMSYLGHVPSKKDVWADKTKNDWRIIKTFNDKNLTELSINIKLK